MASTTMAAVSSAGIATTPTPGLVSYEASGSGQMGETLVATPMGRLDAIYLMVEGPPIEEDLTVIIYDGNDNPVVAYQVKNMNEEGIPVTDWISMPDRPMPIAPDWYIQFAWPNGAGLTWHLHVILADA